MFLIYLHFKGKKSKNLKKKKIFFQVWSVIFWTQVPLLWGKHTFYSAACSIYCNIKTFYYIFDTKHVKVIFKRNKVFFCFCILHIFHFSHNASVIYSSYWFKIKQIYPKPHIFNSKSLKDNNVYMCFIKKMFPANNLK